jgi:hypothetical protein
MLRVLAFDLGLNVGWALIEAGQRPVVGGFKIPYRAYQLGEIAIFFEARAAEIIGKKSPKVIARATRFINEKSNPLAIGPYYGLSMVLDAMAVRRRLRDVEIEESDARKAFLSTTPRKSKDIKAAVKRECEAREWPADDEHACDAIVVGLHVLNILEPGRGHETTPLFHSA